MILDPWYAANLVCPVEKTALVLEQDHLVSPQGREYPVVDGVPVMLVKDAEQTIRVASAALERSHEGRYDARAPELHLESLGIGEDEKTRLIELARRGDAAVDPVVAYIVGATSGISYRHLVGRLREYPIPEIRLPESRGESLLDLGCNWGRWSIAAARKGYEVVGIDPSLGAIMAARRVAKSLALPVRHVVGDARYLPFRERSFDVVFSYSVLQHLSKPNVSLALGEVGRVLRPGGRSLVQMPNRLGIRCLYHQARRGFRDARAFEVRYWSLAELARAFGEIGRVSITIDCFFGLGLQKSDRGLMPPLLRAAISVSERLRSAGRRITPLKYLADSVYVEAIKGPVP